jgi:hypothetical protein
MTDKTGAVEYTFQLNDRGEVNQLSGLFADVKRIQNLLFANETMGTKDMPVNINQFLRERGTQEN